MIKLPLKSGTSANLTELENRMRKSEGLPNFIKKVEQDTIKEFEEVWNETQDLTLAINEVSARMDALNIEVQTKTETVIKPVFDVIERKVEVIQPVFKAQEQLTIVDKPVFKCVEKIVVIENTIELTKLTVLSKKLAYGTIAALIVDVVVNILLKFL